ncbi:MAG: dinitrogenase iron-molybdenum cofactor biosynthesis protein [Candidatus Altiarchaeales archaeon ex4484_96]|nr:MAG: dinitrogenase iron-molybdenum cofactor biosynthesis protein [Candidatus Altiarchaeales archaeon ex4484_96]
MRIAVPSNGNRGLDEMVGEHFGRVPFYTIVDDTDMDVRVIPNSSHHMGGQGYPPQLLAEEGVDIMVCSSLGRRAVDLFENKGIRVYVGATATVRDAIGQWQSGKLNEATDENACRQHAFRGSGQGYKTK